MYLNGRLLLFQPKLDAPIGGLVDDGRRKKQTTEIGKREREKEREKTNTDKSNVNMY